MNTKTLKDTAVSLLIGMVSMSYVHAADTGNQQLSNSATAVDIFVLKCPVGTNNAKAKVRDLTNENPDNRRALMLVQVIDPNGAAIVADINPDGHPNHAPNDDNPNGHAHGEGESSSGWTAAVGDAVAYDVHFEKTNSGAEYYRGKAYCYPGANGTLEQFQDQ